MADTGLQISQLILLLLGHLHVVLVASCGRGTFLISRQLDLVVQQLTPVKMEIALGSRLTENTRPQHTISFADPLDHPPAAPVHRRSSVSPLLGSGSLGSVPQMHMLDTGRAECWKHKNNRCHDMRGQGCRAVRQPPSGGPR